jgi:hypothetical protein
MKRICALLFAAVFLCGCAGTKAASGGKELTVRDFAEVLKKIEAKQSYEAARHYAINSIDYIKINMLARKYVGAADDRARRREKDNDPNLMPSRFMLLYGADDGKLRENGNIDDCPDNFDGEPEHKISVEMLRRGLRLMGYDNVVDEIGPLDDFVFMAFLRYLRRSGRVNIDNVDNDKGDADKPSNLVAERYGLFTWKYFEGRDISHNQIIEELSAKYGDKLLAAKGGDPQAHKSGVSYRYPWVPFSLTLNDGCGHDDEEFAEMLDKRSEGEAMPVVKSTYETYDTARDALVGEGEVNDGKIEALLPDVEDVAVYVDGKYISFNPLPR